MNKSIDKKASKHFCTPADIRQIFKQTVMIR